jgi:hypothetical protein
MLAEDRERLAKDRADIDAAKQDLFTALSSGTYGVTQAARVFHTVEAVAQRELSVAGPAMTISGSTPPSYLMSTPVGAFPRPYSEQGQAQSFDAVVAESQHAAPQGPKRPPPLALMHSESFKTIRMFCLVPLPSVTVVCSRAVPRCTSQSLRNHPRVL